LSGFIAMIFELLVLPCQAIAMIFPNIKLFGWNWWWNWWMSCQDLQVLTFLNHDSS
jgi:hypothetical protein